MKRLALGRGLEALIPDASAAEEKDVTIDTSSSKLHAIPLERINPGPFQPRHTFDPAGLAELAESIKERGMIQPIVVRAVDGAFELVAGERRLRAVERLGWESIPSLVLDNVDNEAVMEIALIENLQREDLNPIEEASAFQRLMSECSLSQAEVAARVGKDRSSVANSLRLLSLPEKIQGMLIEGSITSGHARALLAVAGDSEKISLATKVSREDLSVRQLEKIVYKEGRAGRIRKPKARPAEIAAIEESLKRKLGTKVIITRKRKGGKITIEYYSDDELNRLLEFFGVVEGF
jgi:ParB family chromosome partitioning protein